MYPYAHEGVTIVEIWKQSKCSSINEWIKMQYIHTQWNIVVVQLLSCVQLSATPWTEAPQASLSFKHLLEFAQILLSHKKE